jgi:hypothetical protein
MSFEPTDVFVKDQNGSPIEGVVVKVFNAAGTVAFTQQTTDANGQASFLLSTQQYSMRFYKYQATFQQPQLFTVLEAPEVNQFDAVGSVVTPPAATDPRLCRCSGFFRDADGTPQQSLDMAFFSDFSPILLESAGVIPRTFRIRTDSSGYAQVDLIRGGIYRVTIEAMECSDRFIKVPDQASSNLPDVLFPVVKSVLFDVDGPHTLAVGGELVLTPTVLASSGLVLEGSGSLDVKWTLSDSAVASLVVGSSTLTITGLTAGSTNLQATRHDLSIIQIPSLEIEGQPVSITVT